MPFASQKQERFMFSQHPAIAKRWVAEAHRNGTPVVADMDLHEYRRKMAEAYRAMTEKPAEQTFHDANLDAAAAAYQANPNAPGAYEALHAAQVAADQANAAPPMPAAVPQGPTALPDTTDQPWMAARMPEPLQGTAAAGISPAEEQQEVAQGREQEKADEAKAKAKPAVSPAKLALASTGAGEKDSGVGGSRSPLDVSLVPRAQSATIAAHETPTVDPARIAQLDRDQQAIIGANQDIGQAQDQMVRAGADAQAQKSQLIADQQADMLRHAQERDAYLQRQEDHIRQLSDEVANAKIDPFKETSPVDRARYAIAAALGGFVSGFRGTPNYALQEINQQINRKIELQKEAIERKKGRIGDEQGILASAYRRFGNMDQAEAAARAMGLQQFDAEQQAYAAKLGDPVSLAKSQMLTKQMQFDKDKLLGSLYQYTPARTVTAGGVSAAQMKQVADLAAKFQTDAAANGHEMAPEEARRRAAATLGLTASTGTAYADMAKQANGGGSADERFQKYQDSTLAKGETPLSREEWQKKLNPEGATGAGAGVPMPESVAYNPARAFQGTDAYKKELAQGNYNAAVYRAVFQRYPVGIDRSEAAQKAIIAKFAVDPGDIQDTIDAKVKAAREQLGLNIGGSAGGKDLPQGTPESGD